MNKIIDMYNKKIRQTGFMKHYYTLFSIVEGLETKKSFEFGTGISTEIILEALKYTGGEHISCDIRPFEQTGADKKILNNPNYIFIKINQDCSYDWNFESLDFILHDGSHIPGIVYNDIKFIVPKLKQNGLLLLHDTENEIYYSTLKDAAIKSLNELKCDFEEVTLPYGYGLTIFRILEDFGNGVIKPKWIKNGK